MTPPPSKRPGAATPDAQHTADPNEAEQSYAAPSSPGRNATTDFRIQPQPGGPQAEQTFADASPYDSSVPEAERTVAEATDGRTAPPYEPPLPEAERTVTDDPGTPYGGPASGPRFSGSAFPGTGAERMAATGGTDGAPGTGTSAPGAGWAASAGGSNPYGTNGQPGTGSPTPGTSGTYGAAPAADAGRTPAGPHFGGPGTSPQGAGPNGREKGASNAEGTDEAASATPGMPGADGQTYTFKETNGQLTLAISKLGADASSAGTPGPELEPDAILPPGTPPEAPPEPPHDLGETATGPIPRLGAGPGFPGGPGRTPPHGGDHGGSSGARRALLVGGGLVAALVLGGGGALAVTTLSGGSGKEHTVVQPPPPPPTTQALPTPTPSKTKAKRKPKAVPVDIRDEKKDPKPLTVAEVFPSSKLTLAGHKFIRVKTVINDQCSLAANGPFAAELTRQHCRRVVRATFVSDDKKLAVTTGIAVMPTDAAAKASLKTQDPAHYEFFRGMKAAGASKIDKAGGFAASTTRGRYISYAYATYADGHKPADDDKTLKSVGTAFRDSTARPIERRAKKH